MELDFNRIVRLKTLRVEKSRLSDEEAVLTSSILSDRSLIQTIFNEFESLLSSECKVGISGVYRRKMFLFIILYLYAPSSLAGGKLPTGLRDEMSSVFGMSQASTISNNCSDVVFMYQNFKDFREDVDNLFPKLMERIGVNVAEG